MMECSIILPESRRIITDYMDITSASTTPNNNNINSYSTPLRQRHVLHLSSLTPTSSPPTSPTTIISSSQEAQEYNDDNNNNSIISSDHRRQSSPLNFQRRLLLVNNNNIKNN